MEKSDAHDEPRGALSVLFQEFGSEFLDERFCRRWLLSKIYPHGVDCLKCGFIFPEGKIEKLCEGRRVRCSACGKRRGYWKGTSFEGTHFSVKNVVLIGFLYGIGLPLSHIARRIGCAPVSVRRVVRDLDIVDLGPAGASQGSQISESIRNCGQASATKHEAEVGSRSFESVSQVLKYLQGRGWKISQAGLYKHFRTSKIQMVDGVFPRERVDLYAALHLKRRKNFSDTD